MAENLKVTHYNNGEEIPNITNNDDWAGLSTGAYGDYDNNPINSETYGRLYNWYTVDDSRGVCPEGWHVTSDNEYTVLTDYLGGEGGAGGKMKEAGLGHWNSPNTDATNESGFTGLPAGYRGNASGSYHGMGSFGYFWSSSELTSGVAWYWRLYYNISSAYWDYVGKQFGMSIRCLQDDIEGCTDPEACNYDDLSNVDDGSCGYPLEHYGDFDLDGLGECNETYLFCDNNAPDWAVLECGDCNPNNINETVYDECDVCGGTGYYDNCGICDNDPLNDCIQDCNGDWGGTAEVDECGVCNGPGSIFECGCVDIQEGYCDCNENVVDECGVCNGPGMLEHCRDQDGDGWGNSLITLLTCDINNDAWVLNCEDMDDLVFCQSNELDCLSILCGTAENDCAGVCDGSAVEDECGVCDGSCEYETVQIGHQVWMQENLKATHYRNGDAIPTGLDNDTWASTEEGAYAIYDNDPVNAEVYGNLYNGYIAIDVRGICAENFHIPTDDEWQDLETFLGVPETELNIDAAYRGDSAEVASGGKLKQSGFENWEMPNDGATNVFNFNAIASGSRHYNSATDSNYYYDIKKYTRFWSSTYDGNSNNRQGGVYIRALAYNRFGIYRNPDYMNFGFSIRCISDGILNTTILVPENFATIQEAIDYSIDGDTVLVSAGTYLENINFNGKNIALIGEDRETTIIDGGQIGSVVTFNNGEDIDAQLLHFTITNGKSGDGAGIYCSSSSPTIVGCKINNNEAVTGSADGGGIVLISSNALILDCMIENNLSGANGGGIGIYNGSSIIINNSTIQNNSAISGGGIDVQDNSIITVTSSIISNNQATNDNGGGIRLTGNANASISNTIISNNGANNQGGGIFGSFTSLSQSLMFDNSATHGGAIYFTSALPYPNISNSTIINNFSTHGGGIYCDGAPTIVNSILWNNNNEQITISGADLAGAEISYSDVDGGLVDGVGGSNENEVVWDVESNIDADPLFCDTDNGDFTVRSDSPVLGTGQYEADMGAFGVGCEPIFGCTHPNATNYVETANVDDGSCEFSGDYSLSFDGEDEIIVEDSNTLDVQNLTINIYIKIDEYVLERVQLLNKWEDADTGGYDTPAYFIDLLGSGGGVPYNFAFSISGTNPSQYSAWFSRNLVSLNEWHLITGTYDGEWIKLYLDGNLMHQNSAVISIVNGDGNIKLGNNLKAKIAWVNILDYALTEEEIQSQLNIIPPSLDNGISANWHFNAGSGNTLYDHSGNGNHGTIHGATWIENIYGCTDSYADNYNPDANWDDGSCEYPDNGDYSLSFDGVDDYVDFVNAVIPSDGDVTVHAKAYAPSNPGLYKEILAQGTTNPNPDGSVGKAYFIGYQQDGKMRVSHSWQDINVNYPFGEWVDITVVKNALGTKLYLNGNLADSTESTELPHYENFKIGAQYSLNGEYWLGEIDNILIWDIALDDNAIQNYINTLPINNEAGLLAYYKFNAGSGDILYDHSGNGNHGTIEGAQWAGCTDENSCNYLPYAVVDDGSCEYPVEHYDCEGNCIVEVDECGVCGGNGSSCLFNVFQSQESAFYYFDIVSLDGTELLADDWILATNPESGVLVGAGQYILTNGDVIEVVVMGEEWVDGVDVDDDGIPDITCDSGPINTCGMMLSGQTPQFAVYDFSADSIYNANYIAADSTQLQSIPPYIGLGFSVGLSLNLVTDCNGDMGGAASVNECGCYGGNTGIEDTDCIQDCNGDWDGTAYLDDCSVCSEGNTDHEPNSDKDLCGVCFGDNSTCCLDDNADNYLEDGGCEYHYTIELHEGANLVSFWALPEDNSLDSMFIDLDGIITGVIGEGTAAIPDDVHGWAGSLTAITCLSGYWITVSESVTLNVIATELCPCDIVYQIHEGANLVSWPSSSSCSVGDAIPDEFEPDITGLIGEGVAASPHEVLGWIGSLSELQPTKGYWLNSSTAYQEYNWDACSCSSSLSRTAVTKINNEYFNQSTKQAFYFLESIENIEIGDWILAYNGDNVIGAREWPGSIIDIPAMGSDGSDYTDGYMKAGEVPSFKILRGDELINLEGDIPSWDNNQLYMLSSLTEAVARPAAFSLDRAYPNPFNPVTTLSFAIPVDSEVSLSVYNLQGREVSTLIDANMDAGYHSVVWNADNYSSGVYFVKMVAGEFVNTQKLMLIK